MTLRKVGVLASPPTKNSNESLRKMSHKAKAATFWKAALEHTKLHHSATAIKPGMDEWRAWEGYFHHLGFKPSVMAAVEQNRTKTGEFTVPAQWPEWFDPGYAGRALLSKPKAVLLPDMVRPN